MANTLIKPNQADMAKKCQLNQASPVTFTSQILQTVNLAEIFQPLLKMLKI